ncbi:VWA domain-containing protein [Aquibium sp. A9E412]|uniref:VWA domain-containing protein n=1 Tax=Aquibium sp. A9E412 TaxID=2976767 RepID=UPI0025B0B14F|nr:VWA domain-containing protein [Aquibium sp. A9E412]MDN2565617.1 VWA domain-containing protein [Aquibium sp. A9E412]
MRKAKAIAAAAVLALGAGPALAADDVMVVFDGSNSMWGQIDGTAKIEIAREAIGDLVGGWTEGTNVGLMAYGHRREGDCGDIETMIAPGPFDRAGFMARVGGISPRGKTPLTAAVEQAAEALAYRDRPATVVVITDGIESCGRDPCALAEELERMGVGFTAHVVGFDLKGEEQAAVACMAERTGGRFVAAGNADELSAALGEVATAVAEAPEPEPAPEPEAAPAVALSAPDSAVVGAAFTVSWEADAQAPRDYVTIVPAGAAEGDYGDYARVGDDSEASLRAPAETGLYEVRYVREEDDATRGATTIEIVAAQATLTAPETATAGARFAVSWSGAVHPRDYVTIVPAGAADGEYGDYQRVGKDSEASLRAPAEPGLYEVRYVLDEGGRTLAAGDIEIVAAEASVEAPATATAGARFAVSWSQPVHPRDYVTIVPAGAAEGAYTDYQRVGNDTEGRLQAPAEPGLYEVRYVLEEGGRTLASADIEIVAAEASVQAPQSAVIGASFPVRWSRAIHPRDYVTIVPMGAAEGESGDYARVGNASEGSLRAPAEPGLYEVRYVLQEGDRTLAAATVEVVEADIELSGPDTVRAGAPVAVTWSGTPPHARDYVTLVPMGAPDDADGDYARIGNRDGAELEAPAETGLYEVRYVLDAGKRVLARHTLEVVGETAALNDGGALQAPETGAPGATVEVRWSADGGTGDRRVTLAGADQADFTWIEAQKAVEGPLAFTLPEAPGFYEFRLLDVAGRKVLSRVTIRVE